MGIYLDSCIVIYLIQGPSPYNGYVDAAFHRALSDGNQLYLSDLTRLECRVWPKRSRDPELLAQFDELFAQPEIETMSMPSAVYDLATDLRAEHGLKTADALHLGTALHHGCGELWTNDRRLCTAASDRLRIVLPWNQEDETQ